MTASMTINIDEELADNPKALNKYDMTRRLLTQHRGDAALSIRRQLVRRVVEFEDFSRCYENKRATGARVGREIQLEVVNIKDSFTRMNQAREAAEQKAHTVHAARLGARKSRQGGNVSSRSQTPSRRSSRCSANGPISGERLSRRH